MSDRLTKKKKLNKSKKELWSQIENNFIDDYIVLKDREKIVIYVNLM